MSATTISILHLCRQNGEVILKEELDRVFPKSRHHIDGPQRVMSIGVSPTTETIVAFNAQALPNPRSVKAASIGEFARQLGTFITDERVSTPWTLHVYPVTRGYSPVNERRCALIEKELLAHLKHRARSILKRYIPVGKINGSDHVALVQLLLTDTESGWLSFASLDLFSTLSGVMTDIPAGFVRIPENKRPPSAAYRKLEEALIRLHRPISPGENCVDLGASPGGWSYMCLAANANVIAVDRALLRDDLMRNERLSFVRGDAFSYVPEERVDWMLSDVIAYPARAIELIKAWVGEKRCDKFCVTIKFKGSVDYPLIEPLKAWLRPRVEKLLFKQLCCNKNEITVAGCICA